MGEGFIAINFSLVPGVFIQRLNRFMALVEVDGEKYYAHLPNSGRLKTVLYNNVPVYLKACRRPHRKSDYTIFAAQHNDVTVIVDAQFSNFLAREAIRLGLFDDLVGYRVIKEGVSLNNGLKVKIDLMLERDSNRFYIEVKSVTHVVNNVALFPDAPTYRGRKHILQLTSLLRRGFRAGLIFSVQRPDAVILKPNIKVDPQFSNLLKEAFKEGLGVFTLKSTFKPPETIKIESNKPPFAF